MDELIKAVDALYWPLGGYSSVSNVISESEMADAVTFNGPTWYASSLYTTNGPYYLFDLTTLGYQSGQLYSIHDSKFRFVYSSKVYKQEDSAAIYFGYLDKEKEFLESTTHGSRYFFLFDSPTGPQLTQILIDHTTDPLFTQEYLRDIIRKNAISQARNFLNEAFARYPGKFNFHTLVANIDIIYTAEDVINHPDTITLDNINKITYFQPKHDTWIVATTVDNTPLHISDVDGLDNWQSRVITDENGFELLFINARSNTYNTPINRMINGLGTPLVTNFSPRKLDIIIDLADPEETP